MGGVSSTLNINKDPEVGKMKSSVEFLIRPMLMLKLLETPVKFCAVPAIRR